MICALKLPVSINGGHAAARQRGAVARLERRELAFNVRDLALQLVRLVLQETDGQRRLVLDVLAVHAQELRDEALQDGLRLAGIGIIEAHRDRDRVVLSARLLADVARQRADARRVPHLLDDLRQAAAIRRSFG